MFVGGADHKIAGVRAPSVKGALRFWWRALNWERIRQVSRTDAEALKSLHGAESWLFGNAGGIYPTPKGEKPIVGQSRFLLTVKQPPVSENDLEKNWPNKPKSRQNISGSSFMGYGLFKMKTTRQREALKEKLTFEVICTFKPDFESGKSDFWSSSLEAPIESIKETLEWWGLVGGLGSRARRGFGSIAIMTLVDEDGNRRSYNHATQEAYTEKVQNQLKLYHRTSLPPFTTLSALSRFKLISKETDSGRNALDAAGKAYMEMRSQVARKERIPFGLPLAREVEKLRRAGPLFFHVHPVSDRYVAGVLFLPAVFHPEYGNGNKIDFFKVIKDGIDKVKQ